MACKGGDFEGTKDCMVFGCKLFVNTLGIDKVTGEDIFSTEEASSMETRWFLMMHMGRMKHPHTGPVPDFKKLAACMETDNNIEKEDIYA